MPVFSLSNTLEVVKVKKRKQEIVIPAWNDIIHIAPEPSYSSAELNLMEGIGTRVVIFGRDIKTVAKDFNRTVEATQEVVDEYKMYKEAGKRRKETAMNILNSPSPQIAGNISTIMTALDDIQDFTTTVGVVSRVLGRVYKPFDLIAIGAFTVGELLNRLNLVNRLTGGETSKLCRLLREMKNSSHKSNIKADVDKRMKRLFPSKGEWIEIAQTTDSLFGIGISLGPIVGLVQDAIFGAFTGAPIRFKEWKVTDREMKVLQNAYKLITDPGPAFQKEFLDSAKWAESAAHVVAAGEDTQWGDYVKALVTSAEANLKLRGAKIKEAVTSTLEILGLKKAKPKKHTLSSTRFLLETLGVDSFRQDSWPVPGLGEEATIQDIMDAYSIAADKSLKYWRVKLGVSNEGLFLDALVKETSLHAAAMFCDPNGVITESLDPSLLIYINALESHLNPPPDTSDQKFAEWNNYILGQMQYYDMAAPDLKLLQEAYHRFFEV